MRIRLPIFLLLLTSLAGCGGSSDNDGDGVADSLEVEGWATHAVIFMDHSELIRMKSDPKLIDTDGDGLTDEQELRSRTNPRAVDTDLDGLTDCQELFHTVAEECEDSAFDRTKADGGYGTNPTNADSDPGPTRFKPTLPFTDTAKVVPSGSFGFGDGVSDGDEINGYEIQISPGRNITVTSDPRSADTDGDGLEDGEERLYGGNPTVMDTDGDGCADGRDAWPGFVQQYHIRPQSFLLTNAPNNESALITFHISIADKLVAFPEGGIKVNQGETVDLTGITVPGFTGRCNLPAYSPWSHAQILARDDTSSTWLDLVSLSPSERPQWNARTEMFRWTVDSEPFQSAVKVAGTGGELQFAVTVESS